MIINPYLTIIIFNLMLYFPALRCLIIVDDVRHYKSIKEGLFQQEHYKPFLKQILIRLYSGGSLWNFETCPTCDGNKIIIAKMAQQNCARCKGTGSVEWQRKVFGMFITAIQIDHLLSIILTTIIGVLIYADFHSIWACLLFASSSITTHIAVWLNGRRYAVNIILVLTMVFLIHLGGLWPLLALPLYAITPLFHLTAFFAPVLYPMSIPVMGILLAFFWKKIYARLITRQDKIVDGCVRKYWHPKRIIVIIKTYGFYFRKMILPLQTRVSYGFLYMWGETPEGNKDAYAITSSNGLPDYKFGMGVISIVASIGLLCFLPPHLRPLAGMIILSTIQWCNIISTNQITADRYACMPLVFMSVILTYLLPWQVCLVMVAVNTVCTSQCYRMYENVQGMFDYHFYHWPNITLVNKEYIAFCIKSGNYIKAYTLTRECLRFNPTDFSLLHAAAVCARVANERQAARQYVDFAEKHLYYGQEEVQKHWIENFRRSL